MSEDVRFLSVYETQIKLRVSRKCVMKLLKNGTLKAIKIGRQYRIVDPGKRFEQYLREREEHLFHVPFLSIREVAALTGIGYHGIVSLMRRNKLKSQARQGNRKIHLFTPAEVRRFIFERQRLRRPISKTVQVGQLIAWSKQILSEQNEEQTENAQEPVRDKVADLVTKILRQPEPWRSESLLYLYLKLDAARLLIDTAKKAGYHKHSVQ